MATNTTIKTASNFDLATLNQRKPLWIALSDLFLDTELQEYTLAHIAKTMKESGNSLDEIHDILMLEVLPVCIGNLHTLPGGIWTGFEENDLIKAIISAKRPNRFKRWLHRRNFKLINDDWEKVLQLYTSSLKSKQL